METMNPLEERSVESEESYGGFYSSGDEDDLFSVDESRAGTEKNGERHDVEKLTIKETRNMRIWKMVVFALIFIASCVVGAGTYFFVRKTETEEFEHTYEQYADKIREALTFRVAGIKDSLQAQAYYMVTESAERNQMFPNVTIGSFEVEGLSVRVGSKVQGTIFTPLLTSVDELQKWNEYSVREQEWIEQSMRESEASPDYISQSSMGNNEADIVPYVATLGDGGELTPLTRIPTEVTPVAPWWQTSPPPQNAASTVNLDLLSIDEVGTLFRAMSEAREGLFGPISGFEMFTDAFVETKAMDGLRNGNRLIGKPLLDIHQMNEDKDNLEYHPTSIFMQPVFEDKYDPQSRIIGILHAIVQWDAFVVNLLPEDVFGIRLILRNDCGQVYTYEIEGSDAIFIGEGEFREEKYEELGEFRFDLPFSSYDFPETTPDVEGHCVYTFSVYPTSKYEDEDRTALPLILTFIVGGAFLLMGLTFAAYDYFSNRRNRKVVDAAAKFNSIVSSLFPENVRDRLFADAEEKMRKKEKIKAFQNIDEFVLGEEEEFGRRSEKKSDRPTSILFADISGFTAWSSTREPSQVFELLESIYSNFDAIAEKRGVYKVETIGDCYVAVVGLPKPRKDHAVVMVRFARECMNSMRLLTRKLEMTLGPDTSMLAMRMGIHSGPVTAGVFRGDRARFQLFGDTMNTASRMESNGVRDKIQVSQETAELLYAAGKSRWVTPREEKIHAKGKGELQTYWVSCNVPSAGSTMTGATDDSETAGETEGGIGSLSEKIRRSIKWNTEILAQILKQIVARRQAGGPVAPSMAPGSSTVSTCDNCTVLDEVAEVITLTPFTETKAPATSTTANKSKLSARVLDQLQDYVTAIALLYKANPFHNFDHASHVTMSVVKLLARITDVKDQDSTQEALSAKDRHSLSFGIASDPMVQFACVFSALVHDTDHPGVPNQVLVQEDLVLAHHYKQRSVAEQQSFDLAWGLLMEDHYSALQEAIFATPAEKQYFRQLVTNAIMATDLMDGQLKALRNSRWEKAFAGLPSGASGVQRNSEEEMVVMNRKATIVIEHIIQASDVAHTMQHWHIYRKWNECLFQEMYTAYQQGRTLKDPSVGWYAGELWFFDNYVIPLAKKLKECGVFGVSSDEYLQYAQNNRKEWADKGHQVVEEMVQKYQ